MTVGSHFNAATINYAASAGVPAPAILVPLSGIIAIAGALSIIFGYKAKTGAWLIIIFLIPVTLYMHAFWKEANAATMQMQLGHFLKNLSMLGAALIIAYFGAGPISIDAKTEAGDKLKQSINDLSINKKITLNAEAPKVWEALTNPELTKKYFFGCEVHSQWKEGSPIIYKNPQKDKEMVKGTIEKIEPQKLLQYTVWDSAFGTTNDPGQHTVIKQELFYRDGKTTLSITQGNFGKTYGTIKKYKDSDRGWDTVLQGLKNVVEH